MTNGLMALLLLQAWQYICSVDLSKFKNPLLLAGSAAVDRQAAH